MFDSVTGNKKKVSVGQAYNVMVVEGKPVEEIMDKLGKSYSDLHLLDILNHPYIDEPTRLRDELNDLTSMFDDWLLIFVDPVKGYYIMTEPNTKVKFQRITRGGTKI
jgi:hypothetical protein